MTHPPAFAGFAAIALAATVSIVTSVARAQPVDWEKFLVRSDPVWIALPQRFDHGAFAGNGTLGLTIFQEGPTAMRFAMGRNDVTSHAHDNTRLLMGGLRLATHGNITGGQLRIDLWNAEIRGVLKTESGSVTFRALVHATRPVVLIDSSTSGGETGCTWSWMAEKAVTGGRFDFDDAANPPSEFGEADGLSWCEQKRTSRGSYTAAWTSHPTTSGFRLLFTIADTFPRDQSRPLALDTVRRAAAEPGEELVRTHRAWWHAYYPESFVSVPDAQIEGFYWIQMYKLASAMRPDGMVMDLQGPWSRSTGWPRIWWNLNIQIAYSPVYTANRLELGQSFTRFVDSHRAAFISNAKELWGFDQCATVPHTTSYDGSNGDGYAVKNWGRYVNPGDFTWALWLYWQQYRYSMDESLVTDQTAHAFYPLLKGSVNLYLHLLKPGDDGKLHLPKMHSPEYGDAPDNNYNLSLLRWGCQTLLALDRRYRLNDPQAAEWTRVLKDLTPYPQDENGFMVGAGVPFAHSHRHWSHMLMVWPLHLLSCGQPENKAAVEKTLLHWLNVDRGRQIFGWSSAAAVHLYATLGDGDKAVEQLRSHHNNRRFVMPNTQYIEGSPVYECSLVAASSLQYMLLESWGGTIRVFPAVPSEWKTAAYHHLRAEGAFLISAIHRDGKTAWVRIESLAGELCKIKPNFSGGFQCDRPGKLKELGDGIYELAIKKGESMVLYQGEPSQAAHPCDWGEQKPNFWGLKDLTLSEPVPVVDVKDSLSLGKPASASSIWSAAYDANKAIDGNPATRWSVAQGQNTGWLEVDLQSERTVARAELYEFEQRVVSWSLEAKEGQAWRTVAKRNMIGGRKSISFPPVKARYVRLNILDSTGGAPSIVEFHIFGKSETLPRP